MASLKNRECLGFKDEPGGVSSVVISDPAEPLNFITRVGAVFHSSQDVALERRSLVE